MSVRDLVAFVCGTGDLGSQGSVTSPTRAAEGVEGHKQLQSSRPPGYVREFAVEDVIETTSFQLRLRGRVDGYWITHDELFVEEIKTRTSPGLPSASESALHWAQARVYGALLFRALSPRKGTLRLHLTYLHIPSGEVQTVEATSAGGELEAFYKDVLATYTEWLALHSALVKGRNESLESTSFPFPSFRLGQREMAKRVYRAAMKGGRAFVEAPTGIGKTLSTLFPALKALRTETFQRILYLTAKTPGRAIAESALRELQTAGAKCRAITLSARNQLCVRDGAPCDAATCPLAAGYFDRRLAAMRQLLSQPLMTRSSVEQASQRFQLCPYALSMDLAPWMDVVIGDYNHLFDPRARLEFLENASHGSFVLIDEAHNLVDRARDMFSATLSPMALSRVRKQLQPLAPALAKTLRSLERSLLSAMGGHQDRAATGSAAGQELENAVLPLFGDPAAARRALRGLPVAGSDEAPASLDAGGFAEGRAASEPPKGIERPLVEFLRLASEWLAEKTNRSEPEIHGDLGEIYFEATAWLSTFRRFDERYATLFETGGTPLVTLFCLDPSARLREVLDRCSGAVFFSATLSPLKYFRELLGGKEDDQTLALPSPFPPENCQIFINDNIQTTHRTRMETLQSVAASIIAFIEARMGNYIAFFPSFRYLAEVLERVRTQAPGICTVIQEPRMSGEQRNAFLARFTAEPQETQIGFAVMGGIFGEGVDLVGDRLSGAVVVGVGLPQLSFRRDVIRSFFERNGQPGFDYAYTFPGMNRVIQAAGRVVRSESDRGLLLLIDSRFRERRYRDLLPPWWRIQTARSAEALSHGAKEFWSSP